MRAAYHSPPLPQPTSQPQVAGWDAAFCAHDPVLAALHGLFAQLEQQEAACSSAAAHGTSGSLPPVDPAPLREALAALPGQGFSLGECGGVKCGGWVVACHMLVAVWKLRCAAAAVHCTPADLPHPTYHLPSHPPAPGEMNDAAELLLCVYEKVMEAEGAGGRGAELAATFGLAVRAGWEGVCDGGGRARGVLAGQG